jgi:hypothetical protein
MLPFFQISHVPPLTALAASVYATMLFPGDEQRIDRLACAQALCLDWRARYSQENSEDVLPIARHELIAAFDLTRRVSFDKLMSLRNEAYSAGHVLKFALLLDVDSKTTSSIGKAVVLTHKFDPDVGPRTLKGRWAKFKGVAHLWAAYNDFSVVCQQAEITAWSSFMKDPRIMLAIAKSYRDWAVLHTFSGSKSTSTLDSRSTWNIPENIALPVADFFNRQRLYTGLKPEVRELLDRYAEEK